MGPVIPSPHAPQPSALAKLSLRDKLLLAQAVHEIGSSPPDWGKVSSLLLAHPLIRQQSRLEQAAHAGLTLGRIFGTRECERAWTALMRQRGLVLSKEESGPEVVTPSPQSASKPKEARGLQPRMDRKSQLALAQLLYAERMEELKEQIREKEQQFKSLVKEIDEIKSGQADARLEMELRIEMENLAKGPPLPPTTPGGTVIGGVSATDMTTPGGTLITPTKNPKIKGRARGESLATTPGTDLTKISPRSEQSHSGPNSGGKKTDSAKARKSGDRRSSVGDQSIIDSPTKVGAGTMTSLPSTPSITRPMPMTVSTQATATTSNDAGAASIPGETVMTTEEAEQVVATAAAEAAVKAIQDETAAANIAPVESTESVAGDASSLAESSTKTDATTSSNEVPKADIVVKEQPTKADAGSRQKLDEPSVAQAAVESAISAAASETKSASNKRKRTGDESAERDPVDDATASSTKKTRSLQSVESVEKDNENEAEPVAPAGPAQRERRSSRASQRGATDAEDDTDPVKGARLSRRRSQAKTEQTTPTAASSSKTTIKEVESDKEQDGDMAIDESEAEAGEEEEDTKRTTRGSASQAVPVRNKYSSTSSSTRLSRAQRAAASPAPKEEPASTPTVQSEREKAHRRKQTQVLMMLLTEVSNHTHGNLFHAPIKEQDAPDYYQLIKQPLDIKTIRSRIKEGAISSASQLRRSLNLMFANSLVYNRPGTEVHRMASEMFKASEAIFNQYEGTRRL